MDDENEWEDDPSYEVGFRKPPRQTQFKPGQSGNRKGRPKKTEPLSPEDMFQKLLSRKMTVTDNGVAKRVPLLEALGMRFTAKAVQGDQKSAAMIFNLMQVQPKNKSAREKKLELENEKLKDQVMRPVTISEEEANIRILELLEMAETQRKRELEEAAQNVENWDI